MNGRAVRIGIVLGVALMGAVDEIVFHQLLQWHHFFAATTAYWRIFSDGLFHAFTASLWLAAALMLWRHRDELAGLPGSRAFWGGILTGAGGFQLFDGTVDHKLLKLHQVRMGAENLWLYDATWIASGLLLLLEGWVLVAHSCDG
ncbi:MAG TPA: DUF2243 domain-containing protein [Trueperaceae bacterium]